MKNPETLILIDGYFTFEEAKSIISNIIASKINYHNIKNWSSKERFGKYDSIAQERIPALKSELKKMELILSAAKNKRILIKSEIYISIVDE